MLAYARIASLLEEISKAERSNKAGLAAGLLAGLPEEVLCPCVRLLMGDLWPSWEKREMGMGPEAVLECLKEISTEDVTNLRKTFGEMGLVAEAAIRHKSQHSISAEPLQVMQVYKSLNRISRQHGLESEHRRGAILRGMLLDAEPIEAKYIARTVMRNMWVGLGPQTLIVAIAKTFDVEAEQIRKAYALMPELGLVTKAASMGALAEVRIKPSRPVRPMLIRQGKISNAPVSRAYIPRHSGLRVQVHKAEGEFFVYTMRLRDITSAMSSLFLELKAISHDLIAEAELLGFQNGLMLGQHEMVRYINRRTLSRRSNVAPVLVLWDMLYLDGRDLTPLAYEERRKRLEEVLGAKDVSLTRISIAEQRVLERRGDVEVYIAREGSKGLIARDLLAPYQPGRFSDSDFYIRAVEKRVEGQR
ncbi:DNA ligase [uncultured archaeon]|nr:DNA ligase [uncultured archaeon]